jgi:hypothetical protein
MTWVGLAEAQAPARPSFTATPITVVGMIESKDPGAAENVSGIACARPRPDARRTCVVVDDEASFAQRVTLDGDRLLAGSRIPILTRVDDPAIVGRRPVGLDCRVHTDKFTQLDGEGVTFQETGTDGQGFFYVTGSHGCSRNTGEDRPAQFVLARIAYDAASDTFGPVNLTWRLSEALSAAAILRPRFGQPLDNAGGDGGLDIEAITVDRDRLLVGFRAPNIGGTAFILPTPLNALFSQDQAIVPEQPVELGLRDREGIRDLAPMSDGRVLILTGPAPNQADVPARLLAYDPRSGPPSLIEVAELPAPTSSGAKYEGIFVLAMDSGVMSVIVVHDGPPNGNPIRFQFPIR